MVDFTKIKHDQALKQALKQLPMDELKQVCRQFSCGVGEVEDRIAKFYDIRYYVEGEFVGTDVEWECPSCGVINVTTDFGEDHCLCGKKVYVKE